MEIFVLIKNFIKAIFLISIILFAVSYFQKEKLPDKELISNKLYVNPVQAETRDKPFEVEKKGITYEIVPLYDYELTGLIVTYHNSASWIDYYHEIWKDYINTKDICVVWGENIETGVYKKMNYSSGSFTCYASFKDEAEPEWWPKFKNSSLSNNHILYKDEKIGEMIKNAERGDQIRIKGQLVKYSSSENPGWRVSSTTRTDEGNGACEVVYVTEFDIIRKGNIVWHYIFDISKYTIVISFILLIILFIKEPVFRDNNESGWRNYN